MTDQELDELLDYLAYRVKGFTATHFDEMAKECQRARDAVVELRQRLAATQREVDDLKKQLADTPAEESKEEKI